MPLFDTLPEDVKASFPGFRKTSQRKKCRAPAAGRLLTGLDMMQQAEEMVVVDEPTELAEPDEPQLIAAIDSIEKEIEVITEAAKANNDESDVIKFY